MENTQEAKTRSIAAAAALLFSLAALAAGSVRAEWTSDGAWRFVERVTGRLDAADEKDWWDIGGTQHGIFGKRYNIAFAGYAAAALGSTGDASATNRAARILDDCIGRMLKTDVWAYSQSKSYWGRKPWAPDPCHRENVMYTGHLLHLMALYELFSNDDKYWKGGFDFKWKDGRTVHYDLGKLIDATVLQMRENTCGGVTCEPGLVFFPCNNHPQIAFGIFARLGHGDWSADSAKWEKWAKARFFGPAFGGGAINLVYHKDTGLFYPRGNAGLDGWSALFYEPWAADRADALSLWKRVKGNIDWSAMSDPDDARGGGGCCDPQPVSASVAAAFLAAAARECGDAATAERLENALDAKFLAEKDGMQYLDLNREWRIGATAMRIIAFAAKSGASFRAMTR